MSKINFSWSMPTKCVMLRWKMHGPSGTRLMRRENSTAASTGAPLCTTVDDRGGALAAHVLAGKIQHAHFFLQRLRFMEMRSCMRLPLIAEAGLTTTRCPEADSPALVLTTPQLFPVKDPFSPEHAPQGRTPCVLSVQPTFCSLAHRASLQFSRGPPCAHPSVWTGNCSAAACRPCQNDKAYSLRPNRLDRNPPSGCASSCFAPSCLPASLLGSLDTAAAAFSNSAASASAIDACLRRQLAIQSCDGKCEACGQQGLSTDRVSRYNIFVHIPSAALVASSMNLLLHTSASC